MTAAIRIVLVSILLASCADSDRTTLEAEDANLAVLASLSASTSEFRLGGVKIAGQVTITNRMSRPQQYSNRWLILRADQERESRAWLDSLASHAVDIGTIELAAHESTTLSVYWVFPETEHRGFAFEGLVLSLEAERE